MDAPRMGDRLDARSQRSESEDVPLHIATRLVRRDGACAMVGLKLVSEPYADDITDLRDGSTRTVIPQYLCIGIVDHVQRKGH